MNTVTTNTIIVIDNHAKVLTSAIATTETMREYLKLRSSVPMASIKKSRASRSNM